MASDVETACAPEWVEFDAYASRTARGFWQMGEVLTRIRKKHPGAFVWGLEQRGIAKSAAYRWMDLHQSMSVDEAGRYPSLSAALRELGRPHEKPKTSPAGETETAGQEPEQADITSAGADAAEAGDGGAPGHDGPIEGELIYTGDTPAIAPRLSLAQDEPDDYDYDTAFDEAHGIEPTEPAEPERQVPSPSRQHPATYGAELFPLFAEIVRNEWDPPVGVHHSKWPSLHILDPMAGEGSILDIGHAPPLLGSPVQMNIEASDIYPWQYQRDEVRTVDATALDWPDDSFDLIITSPPYGNRMADKLSVDGDNRVTYADRRGCDAGPNDATGLPWGDKYRRLMAVIWTECWRVTKPGGLIVVDCKDHVRQGYMEPVTEWHMRCLMNLGGQFTYLRHARSPGNRSTANAGEEFRLGETTVFAYRKPEAEPTA